MRKALAVTGTKEIAMKNTVFETVQFSAIAGSNAEHVIAAWQISQAWAQAQPGYLARRLARAEDGTWSDMCDWRDIDAAKAAQTGFDPNLPELAPLMAVIDMSSLRMKHHIQRV